MNEKDQTDREIESNKTEEEQDDISYIRLLLKYGAYPIWLYAEEGVIATINPPGLENDRRLTGPRRAILL